MAKGAVSKTTIINQILKTFDGAFLYNDGKEVRIPMIEDGQEVQIKVTFTCAKDNVVAGQDNALPGETKVQTESYHFGDSLQATVTEDKNIKPVEPTAEERANVKSLLEAFGL